MRIEDYPPQEPPSPISVALHEQVMALAEGITGEDFAYGGEDPGQAIAIFPAARPNGRALFFVHGGGWTNGYKEEIAFLAPALNGLGYTLISASYRLAPVNTFPTNFNDVADAFALAYELAPRYGYARDAIFIGGHSAGGHLTTLLAITQHWQAPRNLPLDVVRGCLPLSGTYDLTPGCGFKMRPRFLGNAIPFNEVFASPVFRIETVECPFLTSWGAEDFPHLITQAHKFNMVYAGLGGEVESVEVPKADHVGILISAARSDKPWLPAAARWMDMVMERQAA